MTDTHSTPTDLYEDVTNRIIELLGKTKNWQQTWKEIASAGQPQNAVSNSPYHGINTLLLASTAIGQNYTDPRWLTFKQAGEQKWKVKKGEKGTRIAYFKPMEISDPDTIDPKTGQASKRVIPMLKTYVVFNVGQLENGPPPMKPAPKQEWEMLAAVQKMMDDSGATINYGGGKAYYSPSKDQIQVPEKAAFPTATAFAGTVTHELAHWTGHSSRLNRTFGKFGDPLYVKEELRAELASAFLAAEFGIESPHSIENHASYIESWISLLQKDKREIFRAASDAQKIANFLTGRDIKAKPANETQAMSDDAKSWVADYDQAEQVETPKRGFAAMPGQQRPQQQHKPSGGFEMPRTHAGSMNRGQDASGPSAP